MRPWECVCVLVAACLLPAMGRADSITTQVSCSTGGETTASGASSCSVFGVNGNTNDDLSLAITPASSPSGYTTVALSESGTAHDTSPAGQSGATSSASLDLTLGTAGADRSGYLQIVMPSRFPSAEFALASLSFSIGSIAGGCSSPTLNYCSVYTAPVSPGLYNFTLGDPFSLQLTYTDELAAEDEDSTAQVAESFALQFRFLDNDGVTPVALSPEPNTWGLILLGALAVPAFALYRRRASDRAAV